MYANYQSLATVLAFQQHALDGWHAAFFFVDEESMSEAPTIVTN